MMLKSPKDNTYTINATTAFTVTNDTKSIKVKLLGNVQEEAQLS